MNNELTKLGREFAFRQTALITAITFIISLVVYITIGSKSATSACLGGVIGIIPNIYFAHKAFKFAGAQASKMVVESFFSGVKHKMVLMAILLGLTLTFIEIEPLSFFAMFCLVMALPLITPFIIQQKR